MAILSAYAVGTATINAGETNVTGQGTTWLTSGLRAGDRYWAAGLDVEIASVNSDTSLTLAYPWPGSNRAAAAYQIRYTPNSDRVMAASRTMLTALAANAIAPLVDLTPAANKLPYYTGAGAAALADLTSQARSLLASTILSASGNNLVTSTAARITGGAVTQGYTDGTAGRLLKVSDFGLGGNSLTFNSFVGASSISDVSRSSFISTAGPDDPARPAGGNFLGIHANQAWQNGAVQLLMSITGGAIFYRGRSGDPSVWSAWRSLYHSGNVTVDANGFLKSASPILRLFSDRIDEPVQETGAVMTRLGLGHYKIDGTLGLAQEGWQIEVPQDHNGNRLVFVETGWDDGVLTVQTSEPVFSDGRWIAGDPLDVPEGRWIDIRLHEEPLSEEGEGQ